MIYEPEYMKTLLKKHLEHTASPLETATLLAALDLYDAEEIILMLEEVDPLIIYEQYSSSNWEVPPFEELKERINKTSVSKIRSPRKIFFFKAAIVIVVASFAYVLLWLFNRPSKLQYSCGGLADATESPTGVYSCRLLLGNGCSILIDSTYKGLVIRQGNTEITKFEAGVLLYKKAYYYTRSDTTKRMYNTITTSNGAQYQVILPDGTKVRLNAASSIHFPVEFSDTERWVEVTGEAFFEVPPNKNAPFYAKVKNAEIKITGTRFNINAYNSNTITTLLTGSLEMKSKNSHVLLKPGEQAIVNDGENGTSITSRVVKVSDTDTAKVISWKKVKRVYTKIPLNDFVLDIGRSYNLNMVNIGCVPTRIISATVCYDIPLEEIVKLFRVMGLHFKQEGRYIIFCKPDFLYSHR